MGPTRKPEEDVRYSTYDTNALPPAVDRQELRVNRECNIDAAGPSPSPCKLVYQRSRGSRSGERTVGSSSASKLGRDQKPGLGRTHSSRRPEIATKKYVPPANKNPPSPYVQDETELNESKIDSAHIQSQASTIDSARGPEPKRLAVTTSLETQDQKYFYTLPLFPDALSSLSSEVPAHWLSAPATSPPIPLNTISTPQAHAFYTSSTSSTTRAPASADEIRKYGSANDAQTSRNASINTPSLQPPVSSKGKTSDLDSLSDTRRSRSILRQPTPWPEANACKRNSSLRKAHGPVERLPNRSLDRRHERTPSSSPQTKVSPSNRSAVDTRSQPPLRSSTQFCFDTNDHQDSTTLNSKRHSQRHFDRPRPAPSLRPSQTTLPRPANYTNTAPRSRASLPPIPRSAAAPIAHLLDSISNRELDPDNVIEALQRQSRFLADYSPRETLLARSNAVHRRPATFHPWSYADPDTNTNALASDAAVSSKLAVRDKRDKHRHSIRSPDARRSPRHTQPASPERGLELRTLDRPPAPPPATAPLRPSPAPTIDRMLSTDTPSSSSRPSSVSCGSRASRSSRFFEHLDPEDRRINHGLRVPARENGGEDVGVVSDGESSIVVHGCGLRRVLSRLCGGGRRKKRVGKGKGKKRVREGNRNGEVEDGARKRRRRRQRRGRSGGPDRGV